MIGAQERAALREGSGDEMIISAGDFLVHALKPAARRLAWERSALCGSAFAAVGEPAPCRSPGVEEQTLPNASRSPVPLHIMLGKASLSTRLVLIPG